MYARVGDRLVVSDDPARSALIIGVPHQDGSPPYIVKWHADGHIAMVSPSAFARIIPGEPPGGEVTGLLRAHQDGRESKSAT
jgi:hypothetical protein